MEKEKQEQQLLQRVLYCRFKTQKSGTLLCRSSFDSVDKS